jgi:endonuclease/exonuclease/phosphatase family metal-dependent hydrolase
MDCVILSYNTHGLPWSRDTTDNIVEWLGTMRPPIICLQEVFSEKNRQVYKEKLTRYGYSVSVPNDTNVTVLSSGLLTAVLEREYTILSECFCSFQDYHNVECFANKGFHTVRLLHKPSQRTIQIGNTHMQSNTEVSWWFGNAASDYRKKQIQQMLGYFSFTRDPVLIAGDMNCDASPHPYLRFLHPLGDVQKKHTFYSTGEDLDHIAWIPIQWADDNCHYCNIHLLGPIMKSCELFQKPWSDHSPILAKIFVPKKTIVPTSYIY